jgi:D-2-hydroxyacid dehydrogenase (NADP+)
VQGAILVSDQVEARYAARLEELAPGVPRVIVGPEAVAGDASAVEVAFFSGDFFPDRTRDFVLALRDAAGLRWLHTFSAGVDHPWFQVLRKRGVRLSTSSGAHAAPIAHTVLLYLLALARDLPAWMDAQRRHAWERHRSRDLDDLVLGVVGLGPIGCEVARLGRALGMRVVGTRRTPRGDEPCETWPLARLDELVALADALVLALPLTDETRRILDAGRLGRMKPGAWLVNVGRGGLVDEAALVESLRSGRLGGAGLDVFEVEPLPPESPLWTLPNVIVTPHNSGDTPGNAPRAALIFLENLSRYARGEALRNEVA